MEKETVIKRLGPPFPPFPLRVPELKRQDSDCLRAAPIPGSFPTNLGGQVYEEVESTLNVTSTSIQTQPNPLDYTFDPLLQVQASNVQSDESKEDSKGSVIIEDLKIDLVAPALETEFQENLKRPSSDLSFLYPEEEIPETEQLEELDISQVNLTQPLPPATDLYPTNLPHRRIQTQETWLHEATLFKTYRWKSVIETCITSIVSIRYAIPLNFDTYSAGVYHATGFVVHGPLGLILTNKHVVTDAPFLGKVIFRNGEEVDAQVVYADPIHDFGFLQIKFDQFHSSTHLVAIPLAPHEVRVGMEIKVPGADAGEKLSILTGTIARIDRPAASYGKTTYSDFNTFYIQASSNTSGGSSGSPVLNDQGHAVALNAGGSTVSASSFFLPLDCVVVALEALIRVPEGEPLGEVQIPRGSLLVEFQQKNYDQCRQLGLPMIWENTFRELDPHLHGCLAVRTVLPEGPADGLLFPGDILLQLNQRTLAHFVTLETILDQSVHQSVSLTVLRNGQIYFIESMPVVDLHRTIPHEAFVWNGDVFHSLSIHLARNYLHSVGGCMLVKPGNVFGTAGVPAHAILVSLNHEPVENLTDFMQVILKLDHGARVPLRYYCLEKKHVEQIKIVEIDRMFDYPKLWKRSHYQWDLAPLETPSVNETSKREMQQRYPYIPQLHSLNQESPLYRILSLLQPSLVILESRSGFGIDGLAINYTVGVGIVIDATVGLILTDRMVIPTPLCRISVCTGNCTLIPGKLLAMDPTHNTVWVQYDAIDPRTSCLKSIPLPPEEAPLSDRQTQDDAEPWFDDDYNDAPPPSDLNCNPRHTISVGDTLYYVSVSKVTQLCTIFATQVKSIGYFFFGEKYPPQHRTINFDRGISFHEPSPPAIAGLLANRYGCVKGFWLGHRPCGSYVGTALSDLLPIIKLLKKAMMPEKQRKPDPSRSIQTSSVPSDPPEQGIGSGFDQPSDATYPSCPLTHHLHGNISSNRPDELPWIRTLDIECSEVPYWKAYDCQLPPEWIEKIHTLHPSTYSLVMIRRVQAGSIAASRVREMDLILKINNRICCSVTEIESLVPTAPSTVLEASDPPAQVTVFRDGQLHEIQLPWVYLSFQPTVEAVVWSGAILQLPHRSLGLSTKSLPPGLYVSILFTGSPAHRDGLLACHFITHVNEQPIHTLVDFLNAVGEPTPMGIRFNEPERGWSSRPPPRPSLTAPAAAVRLTLVDLERVVKVIYVEPYPQWFPTYWVRN